MNKKRSIISSIYALIIISSVIFLIIGSSLNAPYSIEDEKELVQIGNPDLGFFNTYENAEDYSNPWLYLKKYQNHLRFKPVSLLIPWSIAKITRGDKGGIRTYVFIFTCLTIFFCYLLFCEWGVQWYFSALGAMLLFAGNANELWWRWGPSELPALMFLLLCLFLIAKAVNEKKLTYAWFGLFFLSLSALSKESFLILIPGIGAYYIVMLKIQHGIHFKEGLRITRNWQMVSTMLFIIFSIMIIFIWINADGTYKSDTSYSRILLLMNNIIRLNNTYMLFVPIVLLLLMVKIKNIPIKWIGSMAFLFTYLLVTQLFIHKDIFMLQFTRYLMPGQLSIIFFAILALQFLMTIGQKNITIALSVVIAIWGVWQLKNVAINSSYYTHRAIAYQNMLKHVVQYKPNEVVVILEMRKFHEFTYSTAVYLSHMKVDVPVGFAYLDSEGLNPITEYDKYKASFKRNAVNVTDLFEKRLIDDISKSGKKIAVIFADPDKEPPTSLSSFNEGFKEMRSFSQTYFKLEFKPLLRGDFDAAFNSNNKVRYLLLMN